MATAYNNTNRYTGRGGLQPLPDKLPCHRCPPGKVLPHTAFAKNRLEFARQSFLQGSKVLPERALKQLICIECSGAPATELRCQGQCGGVKGLDKFSRQQRTHPDTAICLRCMWEREHKSGPNHMYDSEEDEEDDVEDYRKLAPSGSVVSGSRDMGNASITRFMNKDREDDEYEVDRPATVATSRAPTSTTNAGQSGLRFSGPGSVASRFTAGRDMSSSAADSSPWAKVRAAPRQAPPPPEDDDHDVDVVAEDDDSDEEWQM